MSLYDEVKSLTHAYVRKGGSRSRKDRRKVMLKFSLFAQSKGVKSVGQLGKRHVILYWKHHSCLKASTLQNHWYAICDLWKLIGIANKPPKFREESFVTIDSLEDLYLDKPLDTQDLIDELTICSKHD